MLSAQSKKIVRDLAKAPGKTALLVLAIALGVVAIGSILDAYAVLSREIQANYLGTMPAMATIKLESQGVSDELDQVVASLPGVAAVEKRAMILARMKIGPDWLPLLLMVVDDFSHLKLNRFKPISGAWPPPEGTMLVERTALRVMQARPGEKILVKTPHGTEMDMVISGVVHDPGLAPAWQENLGYGYISLKTLRLLGESQGFDELRLLFDNPNAQVGEIETRAGAVAQWLVRHGQKVHEVQVPPPRFHPHQGQMTAVLSLFALFGFATLILGAILTAVVISTLMVRQIREIGVMKALGARSGQIAAIYLGMIVLIALAAVGLGLPVSRLLSWLLIEAVADLLNVTIQNSSPPLWAPMVQLFSGLLVPVCMAFLPVRRAGKMSIRTALGNYGISQSLPSKPALAATSKVRLRFSNPSLNLAVRNIFRQKTRLVMTLLLLAAGGGLFMTTLNISKAWDTNIQKIQKVRLYDLEIRLAETRAVDSTLPDRIRMLPEVKAVEGWQMLPMAFDRGLAFHPIRTYPDKRHGSAYIFGLEPDSELIRFPVLEGRWLGPDGKQEVVLNHMARFQMPDIQVGQELTLWVEGRATRWHVVGFIQDLGSPSASAYTARRELNHALGLSDTGNLVRVAFHHGDGESIQQAGRVVEALLSSSNTPILETYLMTDIRNAVADHMKVLIRSLLVMALLMASVGIIGLAAAMSMNILERTRELGVLRAMGASSRDIYYLVMAEGLFIGLLSLVFAKVLAMLLSKALGSFLGTMAFRAPLPFTISLGGVGAWVLLIFFGALAATYFPARNADRMTTRESLAYE